MEFARALYQEQGKPLAEATLDAVRLHIRPIVMTSLAYGLGVLPLMLSTGAGSRVAIGTGVCGGVLSATVLAIMFVPLFFVVFTLSEKLTGNKATEDSAQQPQGNGQWAMGNGQWAMGNGQWANRGWRAHLFLSLLAHPQRVGANIGCFH